MEDANIKEVNIEISDINDTQDEKNNEVTLNEADSGSQYIQLKNSETLNISKSTETENNKEEIYFKKLNESEDNNGQEQEITKGSEKSYKEQSERFENSDRELFEKIIIRNEDPFEEYTSENYSLSKCQNITTIKYEGNVFSYLTNPDNSEDFFFIKLNQLHQFELMDKNLYKNKFQNSVKIPYNQLKLFVDEMNMSIKDLNTQIKGKKLYSLISNIVKFLIVFSIFVLLAYFIYFYGEKYFNISENANKNIFIFSYLFFVFVIYFIFIYSGFIFSS